MKQLSTIYTFKITLSDIEPAIWRMVEVNSDITLHRLAAVILIAMGWHGGHLHQFCIKEKYYGIPDEEFGNDFETIDERGIALSDIIEKQKLKQFTFEYDFGDGWEHVVELEKVGEPGKATKYPRCSAGARNCPPEDCGGAHGYGEFLEAIRDPHHPEHKQYLEWTGGDFDSEEFDTTELIDLSQDVEDLEASWMNNIG